MDILTVLGLVVGVGAILGGNILEGGHIGSLGQLAALIIVGGGTVGAAMVQTPLKSFLAALRMGLWVVRPPAADPGGTIARIVAWSQTARRDGLLGLEAAIEQEPDPLARKGLQLLVDGAEPDRLRAVLDVEVEGQEERELAAAKVYEAMGGYSPTIGIIGAVLGLIHVMENLSDPSKLGGGIATAFVATIYGVGLANLLFLPMAGKLKGVVAHRARMQTLLVEGLASIAAGDNPRNIELKLEGYKH